MRTKITATKSQVAAFIRSNLARDMRREIRIWQRMAKEEYDTAKDMYTVGKIQGRVEALETVSKLPEMLLEILTELEDIEDDS